jgi:hypothetical protein
MFDFATVYNHEEQSMRGFASGKQNAVILSFPFPLPKSTVDYAPMTVETDIINYRMKSPLNSDEMAAVLSMVKQRAKSLGQQLWVTMGAFLVTMGVDELGDLRRCDFVRAVNYLVALKQACKVSAQMQSMM